MICVTCSGKIPSRIRIDGKVYNIANRTRCLKCSPFKSYHGGRSFRTNQSAATRCFKHPESTVAIRKNGSSRCRACTVESVKLKRWRNAERLIEAFGGRCFKCGYDKCSSALDFHHKDPSTKAFSVRQALSLSINRLMTEALKCVLICKNCHAEIHSQVAQW